MAVRALKKETVEKPLKEGTDVVVRPPNMQVVEFKIVGTSPYMQHRFSKKAEIMLKQQEGSRAGSKRNRTARDFDNDYEQAMHKSTEGWIGIPASSFRNAMISACRLVNFKMTLAKLSIFTLADGYGAEDAKPLIRIEGKSEKNIEYVRNATGVVDLRARPLWREWSAKVRFRFDADQFSVADVSNLLARVGMQVGIGEGRPDSPDSCGQEMGMFRVE